MNSPDAPDFPALLERFERPLVRYAQSIVGDVESARDVVQDVFIKLARAGVPAVECRVASEEKGGCAGGGNGATAACSSAPDSRHTPHLEAWLFTVTRNRALDHHRKHSRIIPMPIQDDRPCGAPSPAATLESRDGEASLLRLLDALTPNQREVIRLKFQNDLSYREIAEVTQLTVTNIGFLLHTGLKKLRALAAELPQDDLGLHFRNPSAV
jgi:RNA polymerase sigma-70 factor (ECF subfamily)